jgi:hypothetical protein
MTLLQDLLLTSRTVYEREQEFLIAEMTREAKNLEGLLRERPADAELLKQGRARDAYWRRFLSDLRGERERRDHAIRRFCRRAGGPQIQTGAVAAAA